MRMNIINSAELDAYLDYPEENRKLSAAPNYMDEVIDRLCGNASDQQGALLPWRKTHADILLRPGEVSLWAGMNGHGKSLLLGQVMLGCIAQREGVCIASMEMKPVATLSRMARQACRSALPSPYQINQFSNFTCDKVDSMLWMYDQQGVVNPNKLLSVIRYASSQFHVKHFVIDSLMKCSIGEDDYNGQKAFINELCATAKDFNVHIHLVVHSRKKADEDVVIGKMDVKGSGSITDQVDNVFTVWRNKKKERTKLPNLDDPDALLICDKQRHGEAEDDYKLWFDRNSFQYLGRREDEPEDMLLFKRP